MTSSRTCAWCRGPIPARARRDALCCSQSCRQARHRFTRGVGIGSGSATEPLRLAYADPPYPGLSARYYSEHPDFAGEVDHADLIRQLSTYDGWVLHTSAAALRDVLLSCPPGVRVASWHRGERPTRSARPLNAWEPVLYFGGRAVAEDLRDASSGSPRRLDAIAYFSRPRLTQPHRVVGAKPAPVIRWAFKLLGAQPGDQLEDLFPGSGGVADAWALYSSVVDVRQVATYDACRSDAS